MESGDLWLSTPPLGPLIATSDEMAPLDPSVLEELEFIDDRDCRALVEKVARRTGLGPTVGFELPDGTPVEAAWQESRVGVALVTGAVADGWTIRSVGEWTEDDLVKALLERN